MAAKTADHRALQHQQQREVAADGPAGRQLLLPGGAEHDRHQHRDQRDHGQRDAVDAEGEVDPERTGSSPPRTSPGTARRPGRPRCPWTSGRRSRARSPPPVRPARTPARPASPSSPARRTSPRAPPRPTIGSAIRIDQIEGLFMSDLTNSSISTTTRVPANIDSAYDRTKPFCQCRHRPDSPPSAGGQAVHRTVDALGVGEDRHPGQPDPGPGEQRLVDRVAADVGPGQRDHRADRHRRGDRHRPAADDPVRDEHPDRDDDQRGDGDHDRPAIGGSGCSYGPTDGASQFASRSLIARNAPAPTDPTARMIIGTVITSGDSCGW